MRGPIARRFKRWLRESNKVTLNFKYVNDGLAAMDTDQVTLSVIDAMNAVVVRPEGSEGFVYCDADPPVSRSVYLFFPQPVPRLLAFHLCPAPVAWAKSRKTDIPRSWFYERISEGMGKQEKAWKQNRS